MIGKMKGDPSGAAAPDPAGDLSGTSDGSGQTQGPAVDEEPAWKKAAEDAAEQTAKLAAERAVYSRKQWETYSKMQTEFRTGLVTTVQQIGTGFRLSAAMYVTAFALGVVLIAAALYTALTGGANVLTAVFGGLGTSDILAFFITKPPESLQSSRADLAQLQAAFYTWFTQLNDYEGFLSYLQTLTEGGTKDIDSSYALLKSVLDGESESAGEMMKLIDQYCRFSGGTSHLASALTVQKVGEPVTAGTGSVPKPSAP
jgi:hypothetical protein